VPSRWRLASADVRTSARRHPIVSNQVCYNLIDRNIESEVLPYCRARGISVIAYSPLATNLARIRACDPEQVLARLAAETGRTEAQIALNWCLTDPAVVAIVKASSPARVEENCVAGSWRLTAAQVALLERIRFERRSRLEMQLRRLAHGVLKAVGRR